MRLLVFLVSVAIAGEALAQALPNINLLVVRYNSEKASVKPDGELKAQLDEVDKAVAEARRSGEPGGVAVPSGESSVMPQVV